MKIDPNQIAGYVWQGLWLTVGFKLAMWAMTFVPALPR